MTYILFKLTWSGNSAQEIHITLIPGKFHFEKVLQFLLEYDFDILLELAQLINYNPWFIYDQWATREIFHADYILDHFFYCIVP